MKLENLSNPLLSAIPQTNVHNPSFGEIIQSLAIITFGCFLSSIGIYYFYIPMKLAPGGVSGLASLLNSRFSINPSITLIASNVFLITLSFRLVGRDFVLKTIFGVTMVSAWLTIHQMISVYSPFFHLQSPISDRMLACIFGGVFNGFGIGFVLSRNGTTGGTEIAARLLSGINSRLSMAQWLFMFDTIIVLTGMILFKSIEVGFYSALSLYINFYVIDLVLTGMNNNNIGVYIISNASHIISERILLDMKRNATAFYGKGLYTNENKDIIFCVIRSRELPILKNLLMEEDPNSFVAVIPVKDVLGHGFKPLFSPRTSCHTIQESKEKNKSKK